MVRRLIDKFKKKRSAKQSKAATQPGKLPELKATEIWDSRYEDGALASARVADDTDAIDYTQHDFLHRHFVCKALTGIPTHESHDFLLRSLFGMDPPAKVLAVGSGLAHEEQNLVAANIVQNIDAYELSEVAANSANERIASAGLSDRLTVHAQDVTKALIPDNSYDAVFVSAAIHHFFNIEEMMDLFHAVLKPGGVLVYNEYVGPDHHMYHDKVMSLIDKINDCLDERLRYDELRKEIRAYVPPATLEWMLDMDPSEGVHSSLILPLTYQKFDVVQRFDYGGTIMRPFWVGILNNFDFSSPKDQTIARLIGLIEDLMIDMGEIPTYHTIVAARKGELDSNKPLVDNEVLAYKTHGYETEKLFKTLFRKDRVLSCVNFSDENWTHGVLKEGPLKLLVPNSPAAKRALEGGTSIVIGPGQVVPIASIEANDFTIVVSCGQETFDRANLAAPAQFWISDE